MLKNNKQKANTGVVAILGAKEENIYSFKLDEKTRINLSCGNNKIGHMLNWSTLPGNDEHKLIAKGRRITDIEGTCSKNCNGCFKNCYARRSILQHHNRVAEPWTKNTLMIRYRMEECFKQIDEAIREKNSKYYITGNISDLKYKFFRINVSGEIQSLEELEAWNMLAREHPEINFGVYSKNSKVLLAFFAKHGQTADNFCINVSEWHGVMADTIEQLKAMGAVFNVFEYDDSILASSALSAEEKKAQAAKPHCPAVGATQENKHPINPATGAAWKCTECGACYRKNGSRRCVYSH